MNRLIDIGANLAHDSFDDDRDSVLDRARAVGVEAIVVTGSSDDSNQRAHQLAVEHPGYLYATAGVHPHHASDFDDSSERLIAELLEKPEVVAAGECGLDYFRNFSPADDQRSAFRRQLELAAAAGKALFLHQRDAHKEFLDVLDPFVGRAGPIVVHCFTDTGEALDAYIERDFFIGITGWVCDERRGLDLQKIVQRIPDDRIMIETDAPYLMPRNIRPRPKTRRNEPANLPYVLETLAQCRGQSPEALASLTRNNSRVFFALPVIEV